MAGLYAFFYGTLHLLVYVIADRFAGLNFPDGIVARTTAVNLARASVGRHLQKTVYHGWLHDVGDNGAAGDHVNGHNDSPAWRQTVEPTASRGLRDGCPRVVHYWWLVKADIRRPLAYAVVVASLLTFRAYWTQWRERVPSRRAPSSNS
jgi:sulfoxide reductase heme-binding subunit YedZ